MVFEIYLKFRGHAILSWIQIFKVSMLLFFKIERDDNKYYGAHCLVRTQSEGRVSYQAGFSSKWKWPRVTGAVGVTGEQGTPLGLNSTFHQRSPI